MTPGPGRTPADCSWGTHVGLYLQATRNREPARGTLSIHLPFLRLHLQPELQLGLNEMWEKRGVLASLQTAQASAEQAVSLCWDSGAAGSILEQRTATPG